MQLALEISGWILFGNKEIIFFSVLTFTFPKAFPEKTFTEQVKPPSVVGKLVAPATNPAFNLTDKRGAIAFALMS